MIPQNITYDHIIKAIEKVKIEGIPKRRNPRSWVVLHDKFKYPCKLLISWANIYANGQELSSSSFISNEARTYLTEKRFSIIPLI